jgi:site-specific DNA-cytosine methylase
LRVLELFAGIGGFAAAFPSLQIVQAVDIDSSAKSVHSANFGVAYAVKEIASLPLSWFDQQQADLWWMSPPCTPFSQRGAKRDLEDPRSNALQHLIRAVATLRPAVVCLENVVGFETSQTFHCLTQEWEQAGYRIQTSILCPSELGWPNRRPRVYCIASQNEIPVPPFPTPPTPVSIRKPLGHFLEDAVTPESHPRLWLAKDTVDRYLDAMDRVSLTGSEQTTACFAASYGKAIVRSGSYLETPCGYRRFTPREVARLLGYDDSFRLPDHLPLERQWHMLGNSLSLPAVRYAFSGILGNAHSSR